MGNVIKRQMEIHKEEQARKALEEAKKAPGEDRLRKSLLKIFPSNRVTWQCFDKYYRNTYGVTTSEIGNDREELFMKERDKLVDHGIETYREMFESVEAYKGAHPDCSRAISALLREKDANLPRVGGLIVPYVNANKRRMVVRFAREHIARGINEHEKKGLVKEGVIRRAEPVNEMVDEYGRV